MALQHLRSGTAHKRPIPTVMSAGQIAINTNEASPGLFFKDSNGDLVKVGPVHIGTTAPNSSPDSVAATALVTGTVYQILTVGTSDFTLVGASANTVGTIFTATGTTTGTGTVSGQQGVEKGEQWLDTTGGAYDLKIYDGTSWRSQAGEFVNVTGDTMTGDLVMNNADIVFEGATADDYETTLTVTDPTADRTITLPDTTGTVVTTGDTGTVTSTMITDGTIVNADVNASAAIAGTKINPDFGSQTVKTTGIFSANGGNATAPSIAFTGDVDTGVYSPGANEFGVATGGTSRLVIDSSGNVGIGTTSPMSDAQLTLAADSDVGLGFARTGASKFDAGILVQSGHIYFKGGAESGTLASLNHLMVMQSSGNVGIGTTSPISELHVENSSGNCGARVISGTSGVSYLNLGDTADNNIGSIEYDNSINELKIITNNNERMRIDSSGDVMIGTTSNTAHANADNLIVGSTGGTHQGMTINGSSSSQIRFADSNSNSVGYAIYEHTNNSFQIGVNGSERMRIDSSGNVGIGTSSPSTKLHIVGGDGTIRFGTNASFCSEITHNTSSNAYTIYNNKDSAGHIFQKNGSELARIDSSGRLLVNLSSARTKYLNTTAYGALMNLEGTSNSNRIVSFVHNDNSGGPIFVLGASGANQVAGSNALVASNTSYGLLSFQGADGTDLVEGARIAAESDGTPAANSMPGRLQFYTTASGASSTTERMRINSGGTLTAFAGTIHQFKTARTSGSDEFVRFMNGATTMDNGTTRCRIRADGDLENTNNSYTGISDQKLKENIVEANSQWSDIKALQIRNYNFKQETNYGTHTQIGLIAQEVEIVSPGLVKEINDVDAEGNDLGTVTKSVNYSVLYMKAVKALQEAMERIETLEQRLSDAGIA